MKYHPFFLLSVLIVGGFTQAQCSLKKNSYLDQVEKTRLNEDVTPNHADESSHGRWQDEDSFFEQQYQSSIDMVARVLAVTPPSNPEPLARKMALLILDGIFHEAKAASRMSVQSFFHKRIDKAISEINESKLGLTEGAKIWKIYNHGFIAKTPSATVAFDLTSGKEAKETGFALTREMIKKLVSRCDILFISHVHHDHADFKVAEEFINQGKPVVAPDDIWKDQPIYQNLVHLERNADKLHSFYLERPGTTLSIVVYPGHQGLEVINNVYLIKTPEGLSFLHTGDQNNANDYSWVDKISAHYDVDVLLPNIWSPDLLRLVEGAKPKIIISGHENELGHKITHREPYWQSYKVASQLDTPLFVLTWGESIYYSPAKR